ncbi:MAG: hypothetical protein ACYDD4_02875 [Acidimicrobiales bacterium]
MTNRRISPDQSLADRLAPLAIADIDAMTASEIAALMEVSEEEVASDPSTWREAAKVATDEWVEQLVKVVDSGRAAVVTDPAEVRRRLGGRPRVGKEPGDGPSTQVRVRVTTGMRAALEAIATTQGRSLSEVSRDALDEYVSRHAS